MGQKVRFDKLIWTGGVKSQEVLQNVKLKQNNSYGIEVLTTLEAKPQRKNQKIRGKTYVIGDAASFYNPHTKKPMPCLARPAIDQGKIAAKNIIKDIKGKQQQNFKPSKEYPYVIPVGGKYAVVKIGSVVISGFFGWVLKGLIELNYIASIMPKKRAFDIWLKGLKIFVQNDRLG